MIKLCHEYSNIEELFDLLITELKNSELITNVPYSKWSKLVSLVLHKIINPKIYTEGKNITMYKDPSILTKLDFSKYLKERDSCVVAFLEGVSGIAFGKEKNPQVKFACCVSIESIYHLRTLNVILPYLFLSNLLQSVVSGSKTVSAVNGKLYPSGSYPTIQSWLEEQGKELLESPPGDLVTFFDNIGKYIINNCRVRSKKSKSADIVSTTLHKILNKTSTLQSQI